MIIIKLKKQQKSLFVIQELIVFVLAIGLVLIAIADNDYRLIFHDLATSIITYYFMSRNNTKTKS